LVCQPVDVAGEMQAGPSRRAIIEVAAEGPVQPDQSRRPQRLAAAVKRRRPRRPETRCTCVRLRRPLSPSQGPRLTARVNSRGPYAGGCVPREMAAHCECAIRRAKRRGLLVSLNMKRPVMSVTQAALHAPSRAAPARRGSIDSSSRAGPRSRDGQPGGY